MVRVWVWGVCGVVCLGAGALAQAPQPFPRPPAPQAPKAPSSSAPSSSAPSSSAPQAPHDLGTPVYPSAVFLTSYDAGRGQRFYLFGTTAPFADMVTYYKTVLKQKGDELFESPPTHQFETGRFRSETMAFPPSVTIKDYSHGGSAGYPNPVPGAEPARFSTVIQIVPPPPAQPGG